MTLAKLKVSPFGAHDVLTAVQAEIANEQFPFAIDGRHGGTYTPDAPIVIDGTAGLVITGSFGAFGGMAVSGPLASFSCPVNLNGNANTHTVTATNTFEIAAAALFNCNGSALFTGDGSQFVCNLTFAGTKTYTLGASATFLTAVGSTVTFSSRPAFNDGFIVNAGSVALNGTLTVNSTTTITSVVSFTGAGHIRKRLAFGSLSQGITGSLDANVTIGPGTATISADRFQCFVLTANRVWTIANGFIGQEITISFRYATPGFSVELRNQAGGLIATMAFSGVLNYRWLHLIHTGTDWAIHGFAVPTA